MRPRGVDLEIIEQRPAGQIDDYHVILPNHCVINGLPVLVPSDHPIHINASDTQAVTATLTVFVGSLHVQAADEPTDEPGEDPPILADLKAVTPEMFWWWPDPELLTFAACVMATARTHDRNPGEYGRRL